MTRKQETRVKIMQVALRLFSDQGYYQTTTKQIAAEADINEVTLFRHFGNKESLFQETTEYYVEEIDLKNEFERLISQDFKKSICEIALDYLELCYKNDRIYRIQMRLSDEMKGFVKLKLSRGFKKELKEYFSYMSLKNVINGDPEMMSTIFINMMLGAFTVYVLSENSFSNIQLEKQIVEQAKMFAKYYETENN